MAKFQKYAAYSYVDLNKVGMYLHACYVDQYTADNFMSELGTAEVLELPIEGEVLARSECIPQNVVLQADTLCMNV